MALPKYWCIKNKYPEVRDYLAETYSISEVRSWEHDFIGWDESTYNNGCHGCCLDSFYNGAIEITIEQFIEMTQTNSEPNYEIY